MRKYRRFGPGDKVFAKVRGYPPWPARIVGVADEASQISKMRYHIYFYGTGESAVVKAEDVFLFVEHRNGKLGKPRKLKGFNEAIAEIESELSPDEKEQMLNAETTDAADSSLLSDDGGTPTAPSRRTSISNKSTKSASSAPPESTSEAEASSVAPSTSNDNASAELKVVKSRKRKSDAADSEATDVKKTKSATPSVEQIVEEDSSQSKGTEVLSSRSGRKIKPKKFSDFEDDKDNEENFSSKHAKSPTKATERAKPATKPEKKIESAPVKSDDDFLVFAFKGENISIPLKTNRPTFKNPKSPIDWDLIVSKYARTIKEDVLSGETAPDKVTKLMEDWTKEKASEMKKIFEEEDFKYSVLKVENKLLHLDLRIKSSLTLTKPDPKECLKHLDELLGLQVSAIMLKKHPEVVESIKRMRRYVGNVKSWTISCQDELDVFNAQAQSIRTKSDHIFNKFKSLFVVPPGKTFWSVFSKELEAFHKKTQNMSQEKVFAIVKEPF